MEGPGRSTAQRSNNPQESSCWKYRHVALQPLPPLEPPVPRVPAPAAASWAQEFRRLLKRLYGSVHAGWVKYLDVTEAKLGS